MEKVIVNQHTLALAEKQLQLAFKRCRLEIVRVLEQGKKDKWISEEQYNRLASIKI